MPGASCRAGDFDPHLFDVVGSVSELLGQVQEVVAKMSGGHGKGHSAGHGRRHSSEAWAGTFGRAEGAGHWPGGFGGPFGHRWPGPPAPARGPKAGRGDVRAAILALLQEGPRTGYQIMSEINERSGGAWRPSPGAVYPALAQLADEGLIIGAESGGRRTFTLTDAGRGYLQDNPEMARGTWESMAQQESGEVPTLFAQAARLGGGIVQMARVGTPEQIRAAERLLGQTRRTLYRILADDETGPADADRDDAAAEQDAQDQQDEQ
jgi:DNA-binding PadR family transcriptional regulator